MNGSKRWQTLVMLAMFFATLLFGLYITLGSENPSAGMIFVAFAPCLGTGFGTAMWAKRGNYESIAKMNHTGQE